MTTITRVLRAAIYTRVSQDSSGVARSPREQEAESRADCERNGWAVVDVYTDNDRSASRHARKPRPDYARLLADVANGRVDVIVAWEASRLTRDLEAYATLATVCRSAGVLLSYGGRLLDLDNPDDEFNVGLDMLLAQRESGTARKRVLRAVRANAEAGRPTGKVPFGHRRVYDPATGNLVRQEPDPDTAPVVVEMLTRLYAGESLRGIAADLNGRGITTRQGTPWSATKVRQTVTLVAHLGHRVHRGQVVVENAWPAIAGAELFYAVRALLADPTRAQPRTGDVRHLMSGLLACERCGSTVSYTTVGDRQFPVYRCKEGGHVAIAAPTLDAGVRLLVVTYLARPDALAVFAPEPASVVGFEAERKALQARMDEADAALVSGEQSPRAHGLLEAELQPRIDALDEALAVARNDVPAPLAGIAGLDVAERFDALDIDAQRLVIRSLLVDCELRRAPATRRRIDLGLRFRWAGRGDPVEL